MGIKQHAILASFSHYFLAILGCWAYNFSQIWTLSIFPTTPLPSRELSPKSSNLSRSFKSASGCSRRCVTVPSPKKRKPDLAAQQQHSLFDEAEATVEVSPEVEGIVQIPAHARKKRGRRPLPAELPRVDVIHDLSEAEKVCACGAVLTRIGEEVCEKLDIIPAKIQVLRHVRIKYACRTCEGVESDGSAVKLAPMLPQIIPQGIVTPGLLADVLVAKFVDGQPFDPSPGGPFVV
jgi:transposase